MGLTASGQTWDEASSPASHRVARRYEAAWRETRGRRPEPGDFLPSDPDERRGALLALLRTDLALRREADETVPVEWYFDGHPELDRDARVALIYEELCLREEAGEAPDPAEYLERFPEVASRLRRVFDIHGLVGTGQTTELHPPASPGVTFPEAGQTIAGFRLVEELGRGAFARVFLAEERQLADRPVALKVARRGSREPQTLARLQHTNIVPVHSYWVDEETGLHLMCMPYFGRVTLAQVLADPAVRASRTGAELVAVLDRLHPPDPIASGRPIGRTALMRRTSSRAIAWWGARMADALQHAHDRGVLHRDIKPSNVLITGDGMPMLLDFNLAGESSVGAPGAGSAALGGTLAYMAPEHLEALADGVADGVDGRSDIYALGVVLFEVLGRRPFTTPAGTLTITEALLREADERRAASLSLRAEGFDVPPALDAVVQKCLAPEPSGRYASAADLAADLQAVADDGPLRFAREPQPSRTFRWIRRNRRPLAVGIPLALAFAAGLYAISWVKDDRLRQKAQALISLNAAQQAREGGQFEKAIALCSSAELLSRRYGFSELTDRAVRDGTLAARTMESRADADLFLREAAPLRFSLLGFGGDLESASRTLEAGFARFAVLAGDGDWTALPMLDEATRRRLIDEANELLFLWIVALDKDGERRAIDHRVALARRALPICDRALRFATPRGPWEALRARFAARLDPGSPPPEGAARPPAETSARACFLWGLLCVLEHRDDRAIGWLERATALEPDGYWYQFYLALRYQMAGKIDRALDHYNQAVAIDSESPWARHNRAELFQMRGAWGLALEDLQEALKSTRDFDPTPAYLSRGAVLQEMGDVRSARAAYERVIASSGRAEWVRAARLNRAKLDFDAGATDRALDEFDALVDEDPSDVHARRGRALLSLRLGRTARAEADLDRLLRDPATGGGIGRDSVIRARTLALRAMARLALDRPDEAEADASTAFQLEASPGHERLWNRTLLAIGRELDLSLADPEALASLPGGGIALAADLREAAERLRPTADGSGPTAIRALRIRATILSTLRDPTALEEGNRLVTRDTSALARSIRARIRRRAGDLRGARADVERALAIEPDTPRLLELRGSIKAEAGEAGSALADFNRAARRGADGTIRRPRAEALMALDRNKAAVEEWSGAIAHDPEDPRAYLGRARTYSRLGQVEHAMADLERAAGWAGERPELLAPVTLAYSACLAERPGRLPRVLALARRTWTAFLSRRSRQVAREG